MDGNSLFSLTMEISFAEKILESDMSLHISLQSI